MSNEILFEMDDSGVGVLTVNRAAARNALNWAAQEQFLDVVTAVSQTPTARALIITGAGDKAFVAGGDLKELVQHPDPDDALRLKRTMSSTFDKLQALPIPVIAAINGDTFGGGCELIVACDLRIAAPHARFCFAQIKMNLTTGWGGIKRLVPLVGAAHATDLLFTGRTFDAAEAHRLGLIHRIAEEDALSAAKAWAKELVYLPQDGLAAMKQMVQTAVSNPAKLDDLEQHLFRTLWTSPNHTEAVNAFLEKRPPIFNQ